MRQRRTLYRSLCLSLTPRRRCLAWQIPSPDPCRPRSRSPPACRAHSRSFGKLCRQHGGRPRRRGAGRAARAACLSVDCRPSVRPTRILPIAFAGPLRRPQSARRWLVESERRGDRPTARGRARGPEREGEREREVQIQSRRRPSPLSLLLSLFP